MLDYSSLLLAVTACLPDQSEESFFLVTKRIDYVLKELPVIKFHLFHGTKLE